MEKFEVKCKSIQKIAEYVLGVWQLSQVTKSYMLSLAYIWVDF